MAEESNPNAEVFIYMGGETVVPNDTIRVQVHPSVTTIPRAFEGCKNSLETVELHSGVVEISERAFLGTNIKQIKIPDGIERIGEAAFLWCTALSSMRMPPLLESLPVGALESCLNLFSVEIPENVERIGSCFFTTCHKLRNVAIPLDAEIDGDIFSDLFSMLGGEGTDLYKQFGSEEGIVTGLKHRFDNLPIHKIIYYQSYEPVSVDQLNDATNIRISQRRSKLDPTGSQRDCLGMTPLHIMACSTAIQNIELYKVLVTNYPESLITEDRWGAVPLLYAIWGSAPDEIVQFLVESYQSIHPNYEFDWTDMVQTIYRHSHLDITQNLLDVKKEFFPDQRIGWDAIIEDAYGMKNPSVLSYLFKCSVAERLSTIGLKQWRDAIINDIDSISDGSRAAHRTYLDNVSAKLSRFEMEYHKLKETTTLLELALWKTKMNDDENTGDASRRCSKKMKVDESGVREQCRVQSGADIIIPLVLPYMLPN